MRDVQSEKVMKTIDRMVAEAVEALNGRWPSAGWTPYVREVESGIGPDSMPTHSVKIEGRIASVKFTVESHAWHAVEENSETGWDCWEPHVEHLYGLTDACESPDEAIGGIIEALRTYGEVWVLLERGL